MSRLFIPSSGGGSVTESDLAGYQVGYDEITANVTVSSTTEASGTTVISCAAHTFDGEPVVAQLRLGNVYGPSSTTVIFSLWEGGTQIGQMCGQSVSGAAIPVAADYRFTPTAGDHTYTVKAHRISGSNATVTVGVGGTATPLPGSIRFVKA